MIRLCLSVPILLLFAGAAAAQVDDAPRPWKIDAKLYTPADASRAAAADVPLVSALEAPFIRYLWLFGPAGERETNAALSAYLLNMLSREPYVIIPPRVGPEGILLRVNLLDYGIEPKAWEGLGIASPYAVEQVVVKKLRVVTKTRRSLWPGGKDKDGQEYPKGTPYDERYTETVEDDAREATAVASSFDPAAIAALALATQSKVPLLRADWFLANASLPPHYYDLLALVKLKDAEELALFDRRSLRFHQSKATVIFSGGLARTVARNNRILESTKTVHGQFWQTHDFKTSVGEQNVVNNFLNAKRDGGEIIFSLPNGLHGFFLVNAKGERVDEVPIDIATDSTNHDARVRAGRSCITCHAAGIQPFRSDFQLTVDPKKLPLRETDPIKLLELEQLVRRVFSRPDFAALVKAANDRYGAAVRRTHGKSSEWTASAFKAAYDDYAETGLDEARIVYEAGLPKETVLAALKASGNGVLLRRLQNLPIRRDQWEESYAEFQRAIAGVRALKGARAPVRDVIVTGTKPGAPRFDPAKHFVKNPDGVSCGWCVVEMMLLHAGFTEAAGLARRKAAEAKTPGQKPEALLDEFHVRKLAPIYATNRGQRFFTILECSKTAPVFVAVKTDGGYHALLLTAFDATHVRIVNPDGEGKEVAWTRAEFDRVWTGWAIVLLERKPGAK